MRTIFDSQEVFIYLDKAPWGKACCTQPGFPVCLLAPEPACPGVDDAPSNKMPIAFVLHFYILASWD